MSSVKYFPGTSRAGVVWTQCYESDVAHKSAVSGAVNNYMRLTDWHLIPSTAYQLDIRQVCTADAKTCDFFIHFVTDPSGDYSVRDYKYSQYLNNVHYMLLQNTDGASAYNGMYALYTYGPDWYDVSTVMYKELNSAAVPDVVFVVDSPELPTSYITVFSTQTIVANNSEQVGSLVVNSQAIGTNYMSGSFVAHGDVGIYGTLRTNGGVSIPGTVTCSQVTIMNADMIHSAGLTVDTTSQMLVNSTVLLDTQGNSFKVFAGNGTNIYYGRFYSTGNNSLHLSLNDNSGVADSAAVSSEAIVIESGAINAMVSPTANSAPRKVTATNADSFYVYDPTNNTRYLRAYSNVTASWLAAGGTNGNLSVSSPLNVVLSVVPQFTIKYSSSKYCTFSVDSIGDIRSNANGNNWWFDNTDSVHVLSPRPALSCSSAGLQICGGCGVGQNMYAGNELHLSAPASMPALYVSGDFVGFNYCSYASAVMTADPILNVISTDGYITLAADSKFYVSVDSTVNAATTGSIEVYWTPLYNGVPPTNNNIILNVAYITASSALILSHTPAGDLQLYVSKSASPWDIVTATLTTFSAVSGTEIVFDIEYTVPGGITPSSIAVYMNGAQIGTTIVTAFDRVAPTRIGVTDFNAYVSMPCKFRKLSAWPVVKHAAPYTPTAPLECAALTMATPTPTMAYNVPVTITNTTSPQFRVAYNTSSTGASFTVDVNGDMTLDCSGNDFWHSNTDIVHMEFLQLYYTSDTSSYVNASVDVYGNLAYSTSVTNAIISIPNPRLKGCMIADSNTFMRANEVIGTDGALNISAVDYIADAQFVAPLHRDATALHFSGQAMKATATAYGSPTYTNGKLDLTGGGSKCVYWRNAYDNGSGDMCMRIKYTPNYTSMPSSGSSYVFSYGLDNSTTNAVRSYHNNTTGNLYLEIYNSAGASIYNGYYAWATCVSGQEYDLVYNFNTTTGVVSLYIDGSLKTLNPASISSPPKTRNAATILCVGSWINNIAAANCDAWIRDVVIYNVAQAPAAKYSVLTGGIDMMPNGYIKTDALTIRYGSNSSRLATFVVDSAGDMTVDCSGHDFWHSNTDIVHMQNLSMYYASDTSITGTIQVDLYGNMLYSLSTADSAISIPGARLRGCFITDSNTFLRVNEIVPSDGSLNVNAVDYIADAQFVIPLHSDAVALHFSGNAPKPTGIPIGVITYSNDKLNLTGGGTNSLYWKNLWDGASGTMCVRLKYTPNYSTKPAAISDIFSFGQYGNATNGIRVYHNSTEGNIYFIIYDGNAVSVYSGTYLWNTCVSGQEYDLVFNLNTTTGAVSLYIDGNPKTLSPASIASPPKVRAAAPSFCIGGWIFNRSNSFCDAWMRDVVVYNVAQTPATKYDVLTGGITMMPNSYVKTDKFVLRDSGGNTAAMQLASASVPKMVTALWDDLNVLPLVRFSGAGAPAMTDFLTSGGGYVTQQLAFSGSADNTLSFSAQIPHGWVLNSELRPHIHISTVATTGNCVFRLSWAIQANGSQWGSVTFTDDTKTFAAGTANQLLIKSFTAVTPNIAAGTSPIIVGSLARLAASDGADSITDDVFLLGFDFYYQKTWFGDLSV